MNIQLQPYTNEQEIALQLITRFWQAHNQQQVSLLDAKDDLNNWIKEGHQLYLIKKENQFVGFVHLASRGCAIDWLEDIYVIEEYQRQGIGTYTIQLIENIVKDYSDCLYIEAAARNEKAIRLYRKIGYNCLNTITIRKDFHPEKYETIRNESIHNLDFTIKKEKTDL